MNPSNLLTASSGLAPVNDILMYYEVHGEGPPFILLHGGLGNTSSWNSQIPILAGAYQIVALDSRGHGRSSFSARQIGYELLAADVLALMDFLGIRRAHVLGWSDGANIGLHLAVHHPDRINKLIAYAANFDPAGLRADVFEHRKIADYIENAAKDYQLLAPEPARWAELLRNLDQMWASQPNFTARQLGSITLPTLILDGDDDEAILTAHTKDLAASIPGAELTFIAGTGHFAPSEEPAEFNRTVLEFLAR
jgi:pimeloyl-ACP methyl ester carboxylesterase